MSSINTELKGAVEAIIFISERPVSAEEILNVLEGLDLETIKSIVEEIKKDYEQRNSGIKLIEVAGGYQMLTSPNYATFIKKFYKIKHAEKLTLPSLETLAIVAYKQPVTKVEIEAIRGVNVDGVIKNLIEKSLIRIVGRKEVVGRPFVYGTTRNFLEYFGLNSLQELPPVEDFVQSLSERETAEITPLEEEEIENNQTTNNESVSPAEENPKEIIDKKEETTDIPKRS
ncbi:MAG: SMC-Scp complex subunit ScpB [Candidatus Omnitrophica bacterium]|nr:SMC-Scp complex subunit ScpB [Candidatus Omnitrophota bacterium]MDD5352329.1 SMC-Scp complex subunit ScpB [Candidatus Omnitrophota bacterium]MDD5549927.1 SMC-Scp complex subunit ScpB [Candidatus Omnitrophota bacterium]